MGQRGLATGWLELALEPAADLTAGLAIQQPKLAAAPQIAPQARQHVAALVVGVAILTAELPVALADQPVNPADRLAQSASDLVQLLLTNPRQHLIKRLALDL